MLVEEKYPIIIEKSVQKEEKVISSKYLHFLDEVAETRKSEWIDGKLVVQSPASKNHLSVSKRLTRLMSSHADRYDLGYVAFEKALINLDEGIQNFEPDIVFFNKKKVEAMSSTTSMFEAPDFVVEILSKGTTKNDRGVKFINYEKFGVSEYWIVDPKLKTIEQYILQNIKYKKKYKLTQIFKIGEYIESEMLKNFSIPVRALFDTYINLAELDKPIRQIFEVKIKEKNEIISEKEKTISEKEKTIFKIVNTLYNSGTDVNQIQEMTNLSKSEINKLLNL